jgi:hypothetical protein
VSDDTGDRRRWAGLRLAGAACAGGVACMAGVACVLGLALLMAACGGGSPAPPADPPGSSAGTAQALAYATCMRSHGIPDFPDPSAHGNAQFSLGGIDTSSPQFQSADRTCQKQTGFGHFSAAQQQQGMSALLKYAACMRSHGITNWPGPFENSQQIGFHLTGTGIGLSAPKVKAASKTCQPLWPGP